MAHRGFILLRAGREGGIVGRMMRVVEEDMSQGAKEGLSGGTVGWNKNGASAQEVITAQPLNPIIPLAFKPLRQPWGTPPSGAWSNDAFEKKEAV